MKTPEQQTAETMSSLEGMKRAHVSPDFANQVMARIGALSRKRPVIPWTKVWIAAAGLLLLLSANVYVVREKMRPGQELAQEQELRAFSDHYFAAPASNQLP